MLTPRQIALCLLVAMVSPSTAEDWSQWGGPQRSFSIADPGLASSWRDAGPPILFRRSIGDGYSGIVHRDGLLFTMHRDGDRDVVLAIDAGSGETRWSRSWRAPVLEFMDMEFGPGPHSTPAVAAGRVFAVGGTGRLVALEASSGRELWSRELWAELDGTPLPRGYAASPLLVGDLVVLPVGGPGRALVAFRQTDGEIVWSRHDHGAAYASPVPLGRGDETEVVALLDRALVAVRPRDGEVRWSLPVSDYRYVNVASPLVMEDGRLFVVSTEGGQVVELDRGSEPPEPRALWVDRVLGSQVGNAVRFGPLLFGTRGYSAASYLTAVDLESGAIVWRDRSFGDCNLLAVGDRALLLESDGMLRLVELSDSGVRVISSMTLLSGRSWTAPTLVGTRLYVRNRREIVGVELGTVSESVEPD